MTLHTKKKRPLFAFTIVAYGSPFILPSYLIENNTLIYIETVSGDILLANGVQNRRKNSCSGTFNIDVQTNFEKTTAGNVLDGEQITLPPLNDGTNQSSVKKVSNTVPICTTCC